MGKCTYEHFIHKSVNIHLDEQGSLWVNVQWIDALEVYQVAKTKVSEYSFLLNVFGLQQCPKHRGHKYRVLIVNRLDEWVFGKTTAVGETGPKLCLKC